MTIEDGPEIQKMLALFEGDGTEVKQQLIYAGLLLLIFERFKRYVVDQVDGFFAEEIEIEDGRLRYKRGKKFKELIADKGGYKPGQHKNKDFRAALHWFLDLDAITTEEFEDIERLYNLRNEIGHELLEILADHRKTPIKFLDVFTTFYVYLKIVRWWIKEVEVATDPDLGQNINGTPDWDSAESTDTIFLREIINKGLAGMPEWEAINAAQAQQASKS